MKRTLTAIAAISVLALVPAGASARQYTAYAGSPTVLPGQSLNRFFPAELTVRQGDTVEYESRELHTVAVLARGESRPPIAVPDRAGGRYSGVLDPQGNPFFFDGEPKVVHNPAVLARSGDANVRRDDPGERSGPLVPAGADAPATAQLKFSASQRVKVLCLIHPGMQQTVTVLKRRAKGADRPARARERAIAEAAASAKDATRAAGRRVPSGAVYVGLERRQATNLAFFPRDATVPAGKALTFINRAPSEVHDMVFVGTVTGDRGSAEDFADQHQARTDLRPTAGPSNQLMPDLVYGSEPTTSPGSWTYSGDDYGIGYLATPLMDVGGADPPQGFARQEVVVFTRPGTYRYHCAVHGKGMAGTVTVQ